jgi:hypothetical protein
MKGEKQMSNQNQALKDAILAAYLQVDKAIDAATVLGGAAYSEGNKELQHTMERKAYALTRARIELINAMIEGESK